MEARLIRLEDYIPGIINITGLQEVVVAGNCDLLNEPRAGIFNSRQGKTPDSSASWLKNTLGLVEELTRNGATIVSSIGMSSWELVTYKCGEMKAGLILVIPDIDPKLITKISENIVSDFGLEENKVLLVFPDPEIELDQKYSRYPRRDFWIAAIADRIYPISIRPNGNQSKIIELFSIIPNKVNNSFQIEYEKLSSSPSPLTELPEIPAKEEWDYLTHWTKASIAPWPGETKAEYYCSIAEGDSGYSHSAYRTLGKILKDMRIAGSDKLIRGGFEVVSLTECQPSELVNLIKWRPGLLRWTFEPYGIAIKRAKLEAMGARKVIYGQDYQYRFLRGEDRAYFQAGDDEGKNWREEKEWRFPQRLDLCEFEPEEVKVIVRGFEEAEELSEWSPFPVVHWEELGSGEAGI